MTGRAERDPRARSATRRNDPNFEAHGVRSGLARFRRATRRASLPGPSARPPHDAVEPPTPPIDGRTCASTPRLLSTRGSGRTSPSRARGAFGRGRLSGVTG